ncbi:MAG: hypothetical protein Q9227_004084, partial [Pyrenula ochraceoflavens]
MAITDRTRRPSRPPSRASNSSSSSSPERAPDDDNDFFDQVNDSESSLGLTNIRDIKPGADTEKQHKESPISRLPPEIFLQIIAKLSSSPSDLRNCMQVSLYWAVHTVQTLWHRPACNRWDNCKAIAQTLHNGGFFPYHEYVRRLNLSALHQDVSNGSVRSFESCKRIERLTLTNCSKLTDQAVMALVEGNRHLQALDVTDLRELTDKTLFTVAGNSPRLQGLNMTNCRKITDASLVAVSENCRQLKRLKLNNCSNTSDASILSFAANCQMILEIDLHACRSISSASVTALLAQLPSLRELRLAHCSNVGDLAFLDLPPNMVFDSLRILDLTACEMVGDLAIQRIIPATPRLRNLVLAKCKHITDQSIKAIATLGKNLHYIHLGHCTNLSDQGVMDLVRACNRIRYIDLACCNRLTDRSVQDLAQLPKLRRIGLVKCQNLTDRSIFALAKGASNNARRAQEAVIPPGHPGHNGRYPTVIREGPSLERVHLSYCVNLTLQGVHALLQTCPKLTHLSLTGVVAFLTPELTQFCREAPAEFTDQQRSVFCVFSGPGVINLRDHLNQLANATAARYTRRNGETGSESDYGDEGTEVGEASANEDGINDVDGGVPLPGQHTMYHHDEDDDITGEEGDDEEEDPIPQEHRHSRSRRRRMSPADAGRGSSDTIRLLGHDAFPGAVAGPSSHPPSNAFQHYAPHPTVPSQYQFPPYSPNYLGEHSTFIPTPPYPQHRGHGPEGSSIPVDPTMQLEQRVLRDPPELHLPQDEQALQQMMLARHYGSRTSSPFGDLHQQQQALPFTPPQPQSTFGSHLRFDGFTDDGTEPPPSDYMTPQWDVYSSSNLLSQSQPHTQRPLPEHRSSSDILSRHMQRMPAITTPSTTPQGPPPLNSSSPFTPLPPISTEPSSRLMDIDMQDLERQVQSFPPLSRGGSAPATPGGGATPNRSFSGPAVSTGPALRLADGFGFGNSRQAQPWRSEMVVTGQPMISVSLASEDQLGQRAGQSTNRNGGRLMQLTSVSGGEVDADGTSESQLRGEELIEVDSEASREEDAPRA